MESLSGCVRDRSTCCHELVSLQYVHNSGMENKSTHILCSVDLILIKDCVLGSSTIEPRRTLRLDQRPAGGVDTDLVDEFVRAIGDDQVVVACPGQSGKSLMEEACSTNWSASHIHTFSK